MTDQLRECPFCNGDAHLTTRSEDERSGYNQRYTISCTKCGASVFGSSKQDKNGWINDPLKEGLAATRAKWNTRPTAVASHAEGVVAADDPQTDREALVYLMQAFDTESWQCPRCGHDEDCATMDSAYFLRDYLRDHPPRSGDEAGHVVVTRDSSGEIVAVTRQDDDGHILSVIAEKFTDDERRKFAAEYALTHMSVQAAMAARGES